MLDKDWLFAADNTSATCIDTTALSPDEVAQRLQGMLRPCDQPSGLRERGIG